MSFQDGPDGKASSAAQPMPDPPVEEIISFMLENYSVEEIASWAREALRYWFPRLGDRVKVAPDPPLPFEGAVEGGIDHPATDLCTRLLLETKVRCSELSQLEDSELRREVEARLRSLNLVVRRTKGWWRLCWIEEPPRETDEPDEAREDRPAVHRPPAGDPLRVPRHPSPRQTGIWDGCPDEELLTGTDHLFRRPAPSQLFQRRKKGTSSSGCTQPGLVFQASQLFMPECKS